MNFFFDLHSFQVLNYWRLANGRNRFNIKFDCGVGILFTPHLNIRQCFSNKQYYYFFKLKKSTWISPYNVRNITGDDTTPVSFMAPLKTCNDDLLKQWARDRAHFVNECTDHRIGNFRKGFMQGRPLDVIASRTLVYVQYTTVYISHDRQNNIRDPMKRYD